MRKDGGLAFGGTRMEPMQRLDGEWVQTEVTHPGMSLRDWFAGQAMLGIVTGANTNPDRANALASDADEHGETVTMATAVMAYEIADALLKARENGNG